MKKLTPKQRAFCREYVKDFNGTQAAIRAGYSKKTANEQASQHLAKLNIQEYVKELTVNQEKDSIATREEVLEAMTSLVRGSIIPVDRTPIFSKAGDVIKAGERLAKMSGWDSADKLEVTGAEIKIKLPEGVE